MLEILINALIGPLFLVLALIFKYYPAKKINSYYGYRTLRSMRNDDTWHYANTLSGKMFLWVAVFTIIFQLILSFFMSWGQVVLYASFFLMFLIILMMIIIERKLKIKFPKESEEGA